MAVRVVGKGAEATLYLTKLKGKPAVEKKRGVKKYRHPLLDEKLRKSRTRREERVLQRLNERSASVPQYFDARDTSLFFSFEKGVQAKKIKLTPPILKLIGEQLARIHDAGIAHGDFTTSNILVQTRGGSSAAATIKIIDFGLSSFTIQLEDIATDLVLFEKTVSPEEFALFLKAYAREKKNSSAVVARFREIKQRGRYVER